MIVLLLLLMPSDVTVLHADRVIIQDIYCRERTQYEYCCTWVHLLKFEDGIYRITAEYAATDLRQQGSVFEFKAVIKSEIKKYRVKALFWDDTVGLGGCTVTPHFPYSKHFKPTHCY